MRSHGNRTHNLFPPQRTQPKQKRNRILWQISRPNRTRNLLLRRRTRRNQPRNLPLRSRSPVQQNQSLGPPMRSRPARWPVESLFRWLSL